MLTSPIRDNMVRLITSYDGCTTRDPERWLELLAGPNDQDEAMRRYLLADDTSSCALTVRGLWRRLWINTLPARLAVRYVIGKAVEDVVAIAREQDAWCVPLPSSDALPLPGDVVYVVGGEHVWTCTEADPLGHYGVEGGQRGPHNEQAILRRAHRLAWQGTALMDHAHTTRQVRGWVDCDRLFGFGT